MKEITDKHLQELIKLSGINGAIYQDDLMIDTHNALIELKEARQTIKWLVDDANRLADVVRRIKNCTGTGTEGFYSFCGKDSDKLDAEDILFLERLFVDAEFSLENNEALLNNLRRINETSK